jgi:tetratricopeptide (TPR) repeat protein
VTLHSRIRLYQLGIWLALWGGWLALVTAAIVLAKQVGTSVYWTVPLVTALTWWLQRRTLKLVALWQWRRLRKLWTAERFDDVRALLAELRFLYAGSRSSREVIAHYEATALSIGGRHAEALALFESIDRRFLPARTLPWLLNNLAWTLTLMGNGERAVATARESSDASAAAGDTAATEEDLRACQLGTLGAALTVAGRAEEAVGPLEQALARGGTPRQQAARAFFLGEAFHALGRRDDATSAWQRAVVDGPATELGRRARERLSGGSAYR